MMNQNEKEYRNLMTRIGGSLLIFLVLITVSQELYLILGDVLPELCGEKTGFLVSELLYAAMYFASFMLPVLFFRLISRKRVREPMHLMPRLTGGTPLFILAAIGMIYACSAFNSMIVTPLISPDIDFDAIFLSYDYSEAYKVVVHFISISLVPGICEEFLFRGMILGNLLPYGKTGAIIASSILFGLMHQNPLQMFYATMAGIVLGLIYVYTKSILCSMLVHILNNGFSVFVEWLSTKFEDPDAWQLYLIQGVLFLLAGGALILILVRYKRFTKEPELDKGVFERTLPEAEGYCRVPVDPVRKIRLFFAPTIVIFLAVAVIQMGTLMILLMVGLP